MMRGGVVKPASKYVPRAKCRVPRQRTWLSTVTLEEPQTECAECDQRTFHSFLMSERINKVTSAKMLFVVR